MSETELTCSVYDVWTMLTRMAGEVVFLGNQPVVYFGDPDQIAGDEDGTAPAAIERVVILPTIETPALDWSPTSLGKYAQEELFRVMVFVSTSLEGRTAEQAKVRCKELTDALQRKFKEISKLPRQVEMDKYPVVFCAVESIKPLVMPGMSGYEANARIVLGCRIRIGVEPLS